MEKAIPKHVQSKETLKESPETLRTILDSIDADVYVADIDTHKILFMNHQIQTSFGQDLTGEICWKVFRGETQPCAHCTNDQLIDTDGQPTGVVSWEGQNPISGKWYLNHDRAIEWLDGRLVRIQVATDITKRVQVEKAFQESEKCYRIVSELTSDYAYAISVEPDGSLVREWVTGALANLTGFTEDELRARGGWESMIHPEDTSIHDTQDKSLLAGKEMTVEYRIVAKNGEVRWIRDFARPEWDEMQQRTTFIFGAIQDISKSVLTEDEIQRQMQVQVALRKAGAAISSTLDLDTVMANIAHEMGQAIGATSAYINSYEPTTFMSTVIAEYYGPEANAEECVSDLGTVYPEDGNEEFLRLMTSGQHDESHHDGSGLTEYEQMEMQDEGVKSMLYIPLRIRDQLVGYTEIWDTSLRRDFSPEEIDLCQDLAQQAAIALEHARLYEQAQKEIADRKRVEEELANHRDQLEELIEQRTTELHEQMVEQKNILKMMAGREVRMAELKHVITKLRTQLKNAGLEPITHDPLLGNDEEW